MSQLGFALPSTVVVGGRPLPINTTHTCHIRIAQAISDPRVDDASVMRSIIANCYGMMPTNADIIAEMFNAAIAFHMRLDSPDDLPKKPRKHAKNSSRNFDWQDDAARIAADFQRYYNIDILDTEHPLHWWRFMSLFEGLPSDSQTMMAVGIRAANPDDLPSREERKLLRQKKKAVALTPRTLQEAMDS